MIPVKNVRKKHLKQGLHDLAHEFEVKTSKIALHKVQLTNRIISKFLVSVQHTMYFIRL